MSSTGVTITNPLVLYRSLIATQKIRSDPAQHRLAIHLQKLYDRLIDYEPRLEYSQRLQQLTRTIDGSQSSSAPFQSSGNTNRFGRRGVWTSLLTQKERRDSLALTRVLTDHEEAMQLQSPKGLMLHGEVGTGKSMLIDLFQDCLPNRKKRRWHFNTFMLDTISRLEQVRRSRALLAGPGASPDEYSLLLVARDLIETSPILFLDEFQLPDRAASKILSNLMTSFFQLGGVLIATSNRMPEELAKAAGMDFDRPVNRVSRLGWSLGPRAGGRRDEGAGQMGEFAAFLEVLRARCEVWEMEGQKDYRKQEREEGSRGVLAVSGEDTAVETAGLATSPQTTQDAASKDVDDTSTTSLPQNYLIHPSTTDATSLFTTSLDALISYATQHPHPTPWTPATHTVYGRALVVPAQHNGVAFYPFSSLCSALLGPADYITLASSYHTFIITDIPVLRSAQKEEARRLITLLDALYEARCRLLITAATTPDELFFPEPKASTAANGGSGGLNKGEEVEGKVESDTAGDATHAETFSEIYQDLHDPFRPNISSYSTGSLAPDALEDDPPNRVRRPGSSFTDERRVNAAAPNFADLGGLTGADEQFAVKRAESRIWEMCSARWWEGRGGVQEWWRPLEVGMRHWERSSVPSPPLPVSSHSPSTSSSTARGMQESNLPPNIKILSEKEVAEDRQREKELFAHGANPFRVHPDAPPKFSWTHAWGMMEWGKRAGAWGKGVEGLGEREQERKEEKGKGGGSGDCTCLSHVHCMGR